MKYPPARFQGAREAGAPLPARRITLDYHWLWLRAGLRKCVSCWMPRDKRVKTSAAVLRRVDTNA